jgi:beta-lactamase regulating signal transducer with metallopeptidase domain
MNANSSLFLWPFAAACTGSVLFAGLIALLVELGARRWPVLRVHRSVWGMAQAAVGVMLLLAILPGTRISVLPAVEVRAAPELPASSALIAPPAATAPAAAGLVRQLAHDDDESGAQFPVPGQALHWLPGIWLCIYLAGLLWSIVRQARASLRWHALCAAARPLSKAELRAGDIFTQRQLAEIAHSGLTVRETDAAISPLLLGIRVPCLLLPRHIKSFTAEQQQMIAEHEITHWRRRDTTWIAASAVLQTLFWFNLPFRWLVQGLREAVELGCDDAVLAGRSQRERQNYAAALVAQLKFGSMHMNAPAFGSLGITGRIQRMRVQHHAPLAAGARCAIGAAMASLIAGGALLQPAFSSTPPQAPASLGLHPVELPLEPWRYPLEQVQVTSLYGVASELLPKGHKGVDFKARRGTPVLAVAAGRVIESGRDERYGNYLRIDHGRGRESLVIHLDRIAVERGADVRPGELIGTAGSTGVATGPHLHLEYWQDGQRRDPALMLSDLDAHASAKALARRKAQQTALSFQE